MELLKLVIVDDEPILLKGLLETYNWVEMGFEIVGSALSGQQAIDVIRQERPHVVLTDIRMRQITGLQVMEEIKKDGIGCLFIALSAYRDFEYARQACELGAFAYLLKPIEEEKLYETMRGAYQKCIEQMQSAEKYKSWEQLMVRDASGFLPVVVKKFVTDQIPEKSMADVFETLHDVPGAQDRFITMCADLDVAYKITNALDYDALRFTMIGELKEQIEKQYPCIDFDDNAGFHVFLVRTTENATVWELKALLEAFRKEHACEISAAISKPYKGIRGMKRSYEEARNRFLSENQSDSGAFIISEEIEKYEGIPYSEDMEFVIVNAVRKNSAQDLKISFQRFLCALPKEEEQQCRCMHKVMLRTESMLENSYGMTDELKNSFHVYYSNLGNLSASKMVDVCYRLLCNAIDSRVQSRSGSAKGHESEYMADAVGYIEEHLGEENLSIVSVAEHVFLNPVYFGRVFKNTFHMTFKQYLYQQRMERAKRLLEEGNRNMGSVCAQIGISSPSYFSHLFKQYTGMLPSEYKKEFEP